MAERDPLYVKEGDKTFSTAWIVKNVKLSSSSTTRTVKNVQIYIFGWVKLQASTWVKERKKK